MSNQDKIGERQRANEKYLDAIRGSMIGGAVGDALGYPVEFYSFSGIQGRYGEAGIAHYKYDPQGLARISDDTQMTLFTATGILLGQTRQMTRGIGGYYPDYIWRCYQMWYAMQMGQDVSKRDDPFTWLCDVPEMGRNRAPGNTCLSALGSGECGSMEHPLNNSKGCGGIMRVAPVGMYMNRNPKDEDKIAELDKIAAETAAITHGHELGYMPSAALAHIINRIVYSEMEPEDAVIDAMQTMEQLFCGKKYLGDMISLMQQAVIRSKNDRPDEENIRNLGEGWVAEETLAIAIYCALKYKDDFSAAVIAAVNHNGDSDSTGAVTGNIVGARIGYEAIQDKWKQNLECKDVILEIADDLCHDCQTDESGGCQDPAWECKYIYCRRYKV